jgi:Uncharacterized conserved protein (DUF2358)
MVWCVGSPRGGTFSGCTLVFLVILLWTNRKVASFLPSLSISLPSARPFHARIPSSFASASRGHIGRSRRRCPIIERREGELHSKYDDKNEYASKGIVSFMTNLVNTAVEAWSILFSRSPNTESPTLTPTSICAVRAASPPSSSQELLERIREDYTMKNYLWTGDLDLNNVFESNCRFTDPTLSFVGTDEYVKNIRNLRPILNLLTNVSDCRSDLLHIKTYDRYVQTRWNMVGTLTGLPWQPNIDVIGQTKFWYNNDTFQIYFYDEVWEIPASQALLQLITPAGTIPNSSE